MNEMNEKNELFDEKLMIFTDRLITSQSFLINKLFKNFLNLL